MDRGDQKNLLPEEEYLKQMNSLPKVKAPEDFLEKVHERIGKRSAFEKIMRTLEVAAMAAVIILIFSTIGIKKPIERLAYTPETDTGTNVVFRGEAIAGKRPVETEDGRKKASQVFDDKRLISNDLKNKADDLVSTEENERSEKGGEEMKKAFFCLAIMLNLSLAGEGSAIDFSADMVTTSDGMTTNARVFVSADKSRMETSQSVAISRMDKKVVWVLMPEQKMYMEQVFDPSKVMASSEKVEGEIERTPLGRDTVNGKMADKYKVIYQIEGTKNEIFQWIESDSSLPVKSAATDGSWSVEYMNIKTGPQPDSLFEIPADYEKFSMDMPDMKQYDDIGR